MRYDLYIYIYVSLGAKGLKKERVSLLLYRTADSDTKYQKFVAADGNHASVGN